MACRGMRNQEMDEEKQRKDQRRKNRRKDEQDFSAKLKGKEKQDAHETNFSSGAKTTLNCKLSSQEIWWERPYSSIQASDLGEKKVPPLPATMQLKTMTLLYITQSI